MTGMVQTGMGGRFIQYFACNTNDLIIPVPKDPYFHLSLCLVLSSTKINIIRIIRKYSDNKKARHPVGLFHIGCLGHTRQLKPC